MHFSAICVSGNHIDAILGALRNNESLGRSEEGNSGGDGSETHREEGWSRVEKVGCSKDVLLSEGLMEMILLAGAFGAMETKFYILNT
jgi:hypothetical protein